MKAGGGVLVSFRQAVAFLTILPVSGKEIQMGGALAWFPLVGAGIGCLAAASAFSLVSWLSNASATLIALLVMAMVTGCLHLDGFADTVDGLGARSGKESLEVMRDSRIGTFGAVGLFFLLGLKWALFQSIPTDRWIPALMTACAVGRWALVISAQFFPYVPGRQGVGRLATDRRAPESVVAATAIALVLSLVGVGRLEGLMLLPLAGGVAWILNTWFVRRLGGITGDTLGAVNEMVELTALLFLVRG